MEEALNWGLGVVRGVQTIKVRSTITCASSFGVCGLCYGRHLARGHIVYIGEAVGGIKISHMSGLSGPVTVALTVTRGKRSPYTVEPLPDAQTEPL